MYSMQLLDPTQLLFKWILHPKFLPKQNNTQRNVFCNIVVEDFTTVWFTASADKGKTEFSGMPMGKPESILIIVYMPTFI
jgi:hypothetical protein